MESVEEVFQRRGRNQDELVAARTLGIVNRALVLVAAVEETDAAAVSIRDGIIQVQVSHGAIAGRIQQHEEEIIRYTQQMLKTKDRVVSRIVTRLGPIPSRSAYRSSSSDPGSPS